MIQVNNPLQKGTLETNYLPLNSHLNENLNLDNQTTYLLSLLSISLLSRASVSSSGIEANGDSKQSVVSGNGRYIAFTSNATNLVDNDTNGVSDIFLRDRIKGITRRISVASDGTQANQNSFNPSISADGRFITFISDADNLVSGDNNKLADVFLYDTTNDIVKQISPPREALPPFTPTPTSSPVVSSALSASISPNGRYIAFSLLNFSSAKTAIVEYNRDDIYVYDYDTGITKNITSATPGGKHNNFFIANDGTVVYDKRQSINYSVSRPSASFIYNPQTQTTTLIAGLPQQLFQGLNTEVNSITSDGKFAVVNSELNNLVREDTNNAADIFVYDIANKTFRLASTNSNSKQGNSSSFLGAISGNGRFLAFSSTASNLVSNDTNGVEDIFVKNLTTGRTERVSSNIFGKQSNGRSFAVSVSDDGHVVTYSSDAKNLIRNDTNNKTDIFTARGFFL